MRPERFRLPGPRSSGCGQAVENSIPDSRKPPKKAESGLDSKHGCCRLATAGAWFAEKVAGPGRRGRCRAPPPTDPDLPTLEHPAPRTADSPDMALTAIRVRCGDTLPRRRVLAWFPPPVLSVRRSAFLQRVPTASVPRLQWYYQSAPTPDPASRGLIVSPSGTVCIPLFRVRFRAPDTVQARCRAGVWIVQAGRPLPAVHACGRNRASQVPWQSVYSFAVLPRPRPARHALPWRRFRCCPCWLKDKGADIENFEAH